MVLQTTSGSWAHNHQKYTNRKAWLHTATMHLPTNRIAWLCKAMDMHAQTVTCDPLSQPHSVVASLNRGLFRAITALNITTVELNRLVTMGDPGVSPRARGPPVCSVCSVCFAQSALPRCLALDCIPLQEVPWETVRRIESSPPPRLGRHRPITVSGRGG